jgi:hypothetical protein
MVFVGGATDIGVPSMALELSPSYRLQASSVTTTIVVLPNPKAALAAATSQKRSLRAFGCQKYKIINLVLPYMENLTDKHH